MSDRRKKFNALASVISIVSEAEKIEDRSSRARLVAKKLNLSKSHVRNVLRVREWLQPILWDRWMSGDAVTLMDAVRIVAMPLAEQEGEWDRTVSTMTYRRMRVKRG